VALVDGFSPLALGAAGALFVAGCATSFQYLGSPEDLYATTYGRVLAAKIVAFGAVIGLGYFNWRRVKPRINADSETGEGTRALLLRSAAVEVGIAAAVLLLTAVLVALPMPTG